VIPSQTPVIETFTITLKNRGLDEAHNVAMSDTTLIFVGVTATAPAGVSCATPRRNSMGTTTCTTPSLSPGAVMTIELRAKFLLFDKQCAAGNLASARSGAHDPNRNNNTATAIIQSNRCP
jgi:hypothetical protein